MNIGLLIKKIVMIPDSPRKDIEVLFLNNILEYLKKTKQISIEDYNEYKELFSLVFANSINNIKAKRKERRNDFFSVNENLLGLYQNVLSYAKDYEFSIIEPLTINPEEKMKFVANFFRWLDCDVYKLYKDLKEQGLIHDIIDNKLLGLTYQLGRDNYVVAVSPLSDGLHQLSTLVHEMGHVYYYHISKDYQDLSSNTIASECLPKIFERLFIYYLRGHHVLDKSIIDNYEYRRHLIDLLYTDSSFVVNKTILDNNLTNWDLSHLSFDDYKKVSILKPTTFNQYKDHLNYVYNKYSFALLMASIVQEEFVQDEIWGKIFIQEFPKIARTSSSMDIINLFKQDDYIRATNNASERILSKK